MIPVDYELGKAIVETCTCECGAALTLPWGGYWGIDGYVLKCATDPSHDKVIPTKSFYQMWKDGEELPCFIKDNIERKQRRQSMEQNNVKAMVVKQDANKLSTYLQARFPQDLAKGGAALDFARFCIAHQLEPIRDCIPYQGNPYITVRWLDRKASSDEKFRGISYRVYGKEEKEKLDFNPQDLVCEGMGYWEGLDKDKPLVGLGVVTLDEREKRTERGTFRSPVVATHAQQMMFKRARVAVHSQRYHPPAPILEELPYTTVIETEYSVTEEPPPQLKGKAGAGAPKAKAKATKTQTVPAEEKPPEESIEGEGFTIDLPWLNESLKELKWTDDTCKTFLISKYKVSPQGTLEQVIKRLTREQAEDFVNQINTRLEKQASLF